MRIQLVFVTLLTTLCAEDVARGNSSRHQRKRQRVRHAVILPNGVDTGTLSGMVTFDLTTGNATSANIAANINGHPGYFTFVDAAIPVAPPFPVIGPVQAPATDYSFVQKNSPLCTWCTTLGGGGDELNFTVSDQLLTNPSGDPFTSASGTIHAYESTSGNYYITNGLLSPSNNASLTPEPSSLLLLGTGALVFTGALRRRLLAL